MLFFIFFLKFVSYSFSLDNKCDAEIKELDNYQIGINLNLTQSKTGKKYELIPNHKIFAIHPSTGFLQTIGPIDREALCQPNHNCECHQRKCLQEIVIFAFNVSELNKRPVRIHKTICIEDMNDNRPSFPEETQTIELNEKSPIGTKVELLSAADLDSIDYAIKTYDLKCPGNMFNLSYSIMRDGQYNIDHQVKLIVCRNISFRYDPILCSLTACDNSTCSSLRLLIKITDINDHTPEWPFPIYNIKIKENIPLDSVIQTFQATDYDTIYGKLTYTMGRIMVRDIPKTFSFNLFTIDSISGDFKLNGNIDYEEKLNRKYIVTIIAKDNGTPPLSSSTTAIIDIEDFNDNPPIINLNKAVIDVYENSQPQYLDFFTVLDNDEDANGKIECEILEWAEHFHIKKSAANTPITYEIYLSQTLDYEKQTMIALIIQCQDGGKPNLTSKKRITINVIDINDNRVYFPQKTIYLSIPENTPIGTEIIRISTVDLDKKSDVVFSFINPNNCSFVNIDSNGGQLTTNEMFDRETKDEYVFEVQVAEKDNINFTDVVNIFLRINDVNDNKPVFETHYSFSIPENTSVEGFIGQVRAVDRDLGENGTITYSQANELTRHPIFFTVSKTGEIRLFYTLDVDKQNIHQIIIVARDQGRPVPLSSSTTVFVTVIDSNNHPPKFDEVLYTQTLSCQTQAIDKHLYPVTDKDKLVENYQMNFLIENIKPIQFKSIFSIDKLTGTITMTVRKEQCDFKLKDKEKLEIKLLVYDPTKPEYRDKTTLHLYLENEKYQKNLNENNKNQQNQGSPDLSTIKRFKGQNSDMENSGKSEESIDQNVTIIMVLIFVILFLGIFLITIVCFVKRKRQAEEQQEIDENIIMVREKVNASIQSSNKSDFNDHHLDSYQMPLKKIGSNIIRYPTMVDNRRNKSSKLDMNICPTSMQNIDSSYDKSILNYEIPKLKDNNTYHSLTINPKLGSIDQEFSAMYSFQPPNQTSSARTTPQDKNPLIMNNQNLVTNQPHNRSYISVSFV